MEFDKAKENIQPLASGRNAKILEYAINAESNDEALKELSRQRFEFESRINEYGDEDPLDVWFEYISWVEQCYPKSGKEGGIDELLEKCLKTFANETKYFQDKRMVQLYIKYIDSLKNPAETYQQLYNAGIGTLVADFYICWAYYYDVSENVNKANDIFNKGRDAKAQPFEDLDLAHKNFRMSLADRMLNNEDANFKKNFLSNMEEKRHALTSLRAYNKKFVGSLRTGSAVKSSIPGKLANSVSVDKNVPTRSVKVYEETDNASGGSVSSVVPGSETSIIQNIIDNAQRQENKIEPGPWSKTGSATKSNPSRHAIVENVQKNLGFTIMEDSEDMDTEEDEKLIKTGSLILPPNFARKNQPQDTMNVPLCIEDDKGGFMKMPMYDKINHYPGRGQEFSMEEVRAFMLLQNRAFSKNQHEFYEKFLSNDFKKGCRLYPFFARINLPQTDFIPEPESIEEFPNLKMYYSNWSKSDESSIEEDMRQRWVEANRRKNKTILVDCSLDETLINAELKNRRDADEMVDSSHIVIEENLNKSPNFEIFSDQTNPNSLRKRSFINTKESLLKQGVNVVKSEFCSPLCKNMCPSEQIKYNEIHIKDDSINVKNNLKLEDKNSFRNSNILDFNQMERKDCKRFVEGNELKKSNELVIKSNMNDCMASQESSVKHKNEGEPFNASSTEIKSIINHKLTAEVKHLNFSVERKKSIEEYRNVSNNTIDKTETEKIDGKSKPFVETNQVEPTNSIEEYRNVSNNTLGKIETEKNDCKVVETNHDVQPIFQIPAVPQRHTGAVRKKSILPRYDVENDIEQIKTSEKTSPPAVTSKFEIFEDTEIVQPASAFMMDDFTISTQNFNLLIKQSGISTPKIVNDPIIQQSRNLQPIQFNLPDRDRVADSVIEVSPPSYVPKQLSTIIETSETNAHSSTIHTRLCNEEPCSSSESQSTYGSNKSNRIGQNPILEVIKESSVEQKSSTSQNIEHIRKELLNSPDCRNVTDDEFYDLFIKTPEIKKPIVDNFSKFEEQPSKLKQIHDSITIPDFQVLNQKPYGKNLARNLEQKNEQSFLPDLSEVHDQTKLIESKNVSRLPIPVSIGKSAVCSGRTANFSIMTDFEDPVKNSVSIIPNVVNSSGMPSFFETDTNSASKSSDVELIRNSLGDNPITTMQQINNLSQEISTNLHVSQTIPNMSIFCGKTNISSESQLEKPNSNCMSIKQEQSIVLNYSAIKQEKSLNINHSGSIKEKPLNINQSNRSCSKVKREDLSNFSTSTNQNSYTNDQENLGRSIYIPSSHSPIEIDDSDEWEEEAKISIDLKNNSYQHKMLDLDQTKQNIDYILGACDLNPFSAELCNEFLDEIDFLNLINHTHYAGACQLIKTAPYLKCAKQLKINNIIFNSFEFIAKGSYGYIYKGKNTLTGKVVALKQERPGNLWEYFISAILCERLSEDVRSFFCTIDYALIGNESTIYVTDYCNYGTLIDVCNKIFAATGRHLDENLAMVLSIQILSAVDHLHAINIIHGDIKPDNIMLVSKLSIDGKEPSIKLIDFGNSIDLTRFPPNTSFKVSPLSTDGFVCTEMQEGRPWTYQTDLFCVASTIHVLLFGRYMKTKKTISKVTITQKLPRYFNNYAWDTIFTSLLNVPDCKSFPNLQSLKLMLQEIVAEKEKTVQNKINEFNRIIFK